MLRRLRRLISPPPPAPEARSIELAGQAISFTLKRSARRRSIGLRIDHRGLTVSVPTRTPEKWLHSVLQERAGWVVEKLAEWHAKQAAPQQWADGQPVAHLGETLILRVSIGSPIRPPQRVGAELHLQVARPDRVEAAVLRWHQQAAQQLFEARVAHYAVAMQVMPREIKLSAARTRWGSCTSQGVVRLNWQLVKLPLALVDYVVVHELAHLKQMNHAPAFWREVEAACPDYLARRKALKLYGLGRLD
ncbi:MAG: M48 family metallopeptidase [Nitrosomonadales bacterium]|nr:M48 family metallopeptidase [Nitrosomonadales bacterium]